MSKFKITQAEKGYLLANRKVVADCSDYPIPEDSQEPEELTEDDKAELNYMANSAFDDFKRLYFNKFVTEDNIKEFVVRSIESRNLSESSKGYFRCELYHKIESNSVYGRFITAYKE